jgi:hypothetical protein
VEETQHRADTPKRWWRRKPSFGDGVFVGLLLNWPLTLLDRWVLGHYDALEPVLRAISAVGTVVLLAAVGWAVAKRLTR